ncbi:hypothetical protein NDU88_002634 [Pleurodeles waltl]|uniref:Uncharacterized protein n=1 Tax=Pleurodeles waltl TaxID=8319 RepID=A0AAV7QAH0_PLEWA|nr:hypothetical protein NDU88_002634 [Pleurodeles waltl]
MCERDSVSEWARSPSSVPLPSKARARRRRVRVRARASLQAQSGHVALQPREAGDRSAGGPQCQPPGKHGGPDQIFRSFQISFLRSSIAAFLLLLTPSFLYINSSADT